MPTLSWTKALLVAVALLGVGSLAFTEPGWFPPAASGRGRPAGGERLPPGLQREADQLGWEAEELAARARSNHELIREVIAGRRPFADAAEVYWSLNHDVPGLLSAVGQYWGPFPPREALRLNLLRLVLGTVRDEEPDLLAPLTARLFAEYETAYGPLPDSARPNLFR